MSTSPSETTDGLCVVADDARSVRQQFAVWMQELGFQVVHAACGATALRAIRQRSPSIVVTDIEMPHFSGLHLLQILRRDPKPEINQVPVLVCSSREGIGIDRLVRSAGCSAFLKKPVSKPEFVARVQSLVQEAVECHSASNVSSRV